MVFGRYLSRICLECVHCRAALSVALDQTIHVPSTCPNCGDDWMGALDPAAGQVARAFIDALKALLRAERELKPGYRLRLQLPDTSHRT